MSGSIAGYLVGCLGQGPMSEAALVAKLLARGHEYESAVILVKNALTDLLLAKRIEQVAPGVGAYRLGVAYSQMEDGENEQAQTFGGYRNYVPPSKAEAPTVRKGVAKSTGNTGKSNNIAHDDDKTPPLGLPTTDTPPGVREGERVARTGECADE